MSPESVLVRHAVLRGCVPQCSELDARCAWTHHRVSIVDTQRQDRAGGLPLPDKTLNLE